MSATSWLRRLTTRRDTVTSAPVTVASLEAVIDHSALDAARLAVERRLAEHRRLADLDWAEPVCPPQSAARLEPAPQHQPGSTFGMCRWYR